MASHKAQLIVALDVSSLGEVRDLVDALENQIDIFKIGSQLFTACGPAAVRYVQAKGKKVFLDLKFHDIPNTVANSVEAAVGLNEAIMRSQGLAFVKDPHVPDVVKKIGKGQMTGLFMYTLHVLGGLEMMRAAVEAGRKAADAQKVPRPLAVGVTVLTSEAAGTDTKAKVLERALLAQKAGLDGVVASCEETAFLRKEFGKDFIIVTPGIRLSGEATGDQKRVATPAEAVKSGSSFLVVGRPVVKAPNPVQTVKKILSEIQGA